MDIHKSKRVLYLDILRVFAGFCVVIIHQSSYIGYYNGFGTLRWYFADIRYALPQCAVPLFFMVSGALLLDYRKKYSTIEFYKKRFIKILIPFIIWSVIYIIWGQFFTKAINIKSVKDVAYIFLIKGAFPHFWFFYSILGLYLVTPILSVFVHNANKKLILFFIILCLIQNSVFQLTYLFSKQSLQFSIPLATEYVGYFIFGWYINKIQINEKQKRIIYSVGVVCVIAVMIGTYYIYKIKGISDLFFTSNNGIFVALYSAAVFIFFMSVNWHSIINNQLKVRIIQTLSDVTFHIYIIHMIFWYYSGRYVFTNIASMRYMLLGPIEVYLASLITVLILKKIPIIRYIVS